MATRRGFLGALLGMAAMPLLARIPMLETSGTELLLETPLNVDCVTRFAGMLLSLRVENESKVKTFSAERLEGWSAIRALREDKLLMSMAVPPGGSTTWTPPPGAELIFTPENPITFDVSSLLLVKAVYRDAKGRTRFRSIQNGLITDVPMERP